MQTAIFALLFSLFVVTAVVFAYRVVKAVPTEDRTYYDKPPKALSRVWPLIVLVSFYVGPYLSIEYREKTIRRLRKVELDYALAPQQWFAAKIVYGILIGLFVLGMCVWIKLHSTFVPLMGFAFGFYYLEIWMRDRVKRVELEVLKNLPTFLDMLTLAVESGCNLTVGISIAVEKTLPCASVLSDNVPPPSSAPCRRKLSACRLGSSNRSTSPVITPEKCCATRSRVNDSVMSGYQSGRSAMTPTLAVSPLSPDRACAMSTSRTFMRGARRWSVRRTCPRVRASKRRSLRPSVGRRRSR